MSRAPSVGLWRLLAACLELEIRNKIGWIKGYQAINFM